MVRGASRASARGAPVPPAGHRGSAPEYGGSRRTRWTRTTDNRLRTKGGVMPLTPQDVSNKRFTPVRLREGYDMGEVDQFLDEVESELARLLGENDNLREKGSGADGRPGPSTDAAPTTEADTGPDSGNGTGTDTGNVASNGTGSGTSNGTAPTAAPG